MTNSPFSAVCTAITGPDDSLLFIEIYTDDRQEMELESIVFCSLDYFSQMQGRGRNQRFLGLLPMPDSRYNVWGYKAALGYKIHLLTTPVQAPPENAIKQVCERIKDALFEAISNPFYKEFSPFRNEAIKTKIRDIITNGSHAYD